MDSYGRYGDFGKWLQGELDQRGWTQAEFARRINVDGAKVSRWCFHQGPYVELRGRSAQKLADGLGVPVDLVLAKANVIDALHNEKGDALCNLVMRIDWEANDDLYDPIRAMLLRILDGQRAKAAQKLIGESKLQGHALLT